MTGSNVVFRSFQPGDAEAFRDLNTRWIEKYFRMEEKDRETLNDPERYILSRGGHIVMAERAGAAVGCCALLPLDDGRFEVAKMTIAESERGKGLGRQLLQQVIQIAKERNMKHLYLETNSKLANAVGLYEAVGFRHLSAEKVKPSPYARANVYMELVLA